MSRSFEIDEVIHYLPHNLNLLVTNQEGQSHIETMTLSNIGNIVSGEYEKVQLILRPSIQLEAEFTHKGEVVNPKQWIESCGKIEFYHCEDYGFGMHGRNCKGVEHHSTLKEYLKLFEWHIDVFGLIHAGRAVNIDTVEDINQKGGQS